MIRFIQTNSSLDENKSNRPWRLFDVIYDWDGELLSKDLRYDGISTILIKKGKERILSFYPG